MSSCPAGWIHENPNDPTECDNDNPATASRSGYLYVDTGTVLDYGTAYTWWVHARNSDGWSEAAYASASCGGAYDFTWNPSNDISAVQGSSATYLFSLTPTSGASTAYRYQYDFQTGDGGVRLAASGIPSGATYSFSPNNDYGQAPNSMFRDGTDGSWTLTIYAGTAVPGSYPITVLGTASDSGSVSHRFTFTLTVTPAPPTCTPQNICSSGNVVDSCTNAIVQSCSNGCSNGACLSTSTVALTLDAPKIASGSSTVLRWTSQNASTCSGTGFTTNGASSGSLPVLPTQTTLYSVTCGSGSDSKTLTVAQPPTATITSSLGTSIKVGQSTTIHATFTPGANDTLSADNIDSPLGTGLGASTNPDASKDITFAPSAAGSYSFYARAQTPYFPWATYNSVTVSAVMNPAPTCTVSLSPSSYNAPGSATLTYSSTNATSFYINSVGYVGASGSITVSPSATTNYGGSVSGPGGSSTCPATLTVHPYCTTPWGTTVTHGGNVTAYQAVTVAYGSSCTSQIRTCSDGSLSGSFQYSSCSVNPPMSCTLDGAAVPHGSSRTFYSTQTTPSGQLCSSATYSQSRTCTNGTLSGSSSFQYSSCSCTPTYSCSDNAIRYTNSSCSTSSVTTCTSPSFCSAGSAVCLYPPITFDAFIDGDGTYQDGHLAAKPRIVPPGLIATLYWNVHNAENCFVSGTDGEEWNTTSSGTNGKITLPIMQQTTFTLACTALPDGTPPSISESVTVNILPVFREK